MGKYLALFCLIVFSLVFFAGCETTEAPEKEEVQDDELIVTGDDKKIYVSTDTEECTRILYQCTDGKEPFFDDSGCGCETVEDVEETHEDSEEAPDKQFKCPAERADICTQQYDPVCGWFGQNIQCITFPCASTYSNGCMACANEDVEYYTKGECPTQNP